ncbi:hypothetical protein Pth03_48180 [Planotetraspora thailandica]|uniref:Uncharacterized protein n=1 Tax=Planotetraspora thailandica TaxID=487172 RepID=A0A8J3V9B1_9ACTN|nr:SCO5389 family protein [Planotetraspora thailandica]GII56429.1 hypothetical protein Pth03_48180 [Planotetraspora thailandica]
MSLTVPPALLEQAREGKVSTVDFVDCVRTSLPYAWEVVSRLVKEREASEAAFAENYEAPPDEVARGQLLRCMASNAMRDALEAYFGIRLAFQNCHKVAVFSTAATDAYNRFITAEAQILNQRPELVDC